MEWQVSTPKHIMLYEAFGWTPPKFGHLPLIVNSDGSKLSKRQGDVHLEFYKEKGYFPETMLKFSTLMGGGFADLRPDSTKIFTMAEIKSKFDLFKVSTNPAKT